MRFATFEGERSVGDLADRLFVGLTARQRETAVAALVRANPRLAQIEEVPAGAVLEVPNIPALRPKTARTVATPDSQALLLLGEAVQSYARRLIERHEEDVAAIKAESTLISSARFTRAVAQSGAVRTLAEEARAALQTRVKDATLKARTLETALAKASTDIEARVKQS
jgi:phage tail protein X